MSCLQQQSMSEDFRTPSRRVYLTADHSLWTIVDAVDYDWIIEHRWNWGQAGVFDFRGTKRHWRPLYAKRNVGKTRTTIWLHRDIMKRVVVKPELWYLTRVVDHINGQTLDNRRCNLRWLSHSENRKNRVPRDLIPRLVWIWDNLCIDASAQTEEMPF